MTTRIIHTLTDLESIDPDTILLDSVEPYTADHAVAAIYDEAYEARAFLPAVVVATGAQVRTARQALEEIK